MEIIPFILSCSSFFINISASISSLYAVFHLIKYERRQRDTNILLVLNTYVIVSIWSTIQCSLNVHAILGDQNWYVYVDSLACQVRGYLYLNMVPWLYLSFVLQAYIRMVNIVSPQRLRTYSWNRYLIFMIICYLAAFLVMLPTFVFFKMIAYMSEEFQCISDLNRWQGNIYMVLTFNLIPINAIVFIYIRILKHVRQSSIRMQSERNRTAQRDIQVVRRILILVGMLVILGFPSSVLWFESLIQGKMHPISYRVQAFFLSISICSMAWGIALINPQVKRLLPIVNRRRSAVQISVQPQQPIHTISHVL